MNVLDQVEELFERLERSTPPPPPLSKLESRAAQFKRRKAIAIAGGTLLAGILGGLAVQAFNSPVSEYLVDVGSGPSSAQEPQDDSISDIVLREELVGRWRIVGRENLPPGDPDAELEEYVVFFSLLDVADRLSFSDGCNFSSGQLQWSQRRFVVVEDPPESDLGSDSPVCPDRKGFTLDVSPGLTIDVSYASDKVTLMGESEPGLAWEIRLAREPVESREISPTTVTTTTLPPDPNS